MSKDVIAKLKKCREPSPAHEDFEAYQITTRLLIYSFKSNDGLNLRIRISNAFELKELSELTASFTGYFNKNRILTTAHSKNVRRMSVDPSYGLPPGIRGIHSLPDIIHLKLIIKVREEIKR